MNVVMLRIYYRLTLQKTTCTYWGFNSMLPTHLVLDFFIKTAPSAFDYIFLIGQD